MMMISEANFSCDFVPSSSLTIGVILECRPQNFEVKSLIINQNRTEKYKCATGIACNFVMFGQKGKLFRAEALFQK